MVGKRLTSSRAGEGGQCSCRSEQREVGNGVRVVGPQRCQRLGFDSQKRMCWRVQCDILFYRINLVSLFRREWGEGHKWKPGNELGGSNIIWERGDGGGHGAFKGGVRFWVYLEGRAGFPDRLDME